MQDNPSCPMCNSGLELKQINLNYAVFICPDLKCLYPVNHNDCLLVKRRLKDIKKPLNVIKKEWESKNIKFEVIRHPDSVVSSIASSPSMVSETDFPMAEIDDLLNSIDNYSQKPSNASNSQDSTTNDFTDINLESIFSEVSDETGKQKEPTSEAIHSLGDELNIVPISDSQYQNMDNFLIDLLK